MVAAINKTELSKKIAQKLGISKKNSDIFLNTLIDTITEELKNQTDIKITGFGTFKVKEKPARFAINPKTHEKIEVPPRKVVVFKTSKHINQIVNE